MIDHLFTAEDIDTAWRLFSALLSGSIIGLNRFLKHKAAGMRTHAITALSTALATIVALQIGDIDGASRVIQGLLTGVGFIGAGVIMRNGDTHVRVQGLTTAATIWICAVIGIACGAGKIGIAIIAVIITLTVLLTGRSLERFVARLVHDQNAADDKND